MKKLIAIMMVLIIAAAFVSGCEKKESPAPATTEQAAPAQEAAPAAPAAPAEPAKK